MEDEGITIITKEIPIYREDPFYVNHCMEREELILSPEDDLP